MAKKVDHKEPKDRAHMWERPKREDETADAAVVLDYPHVLPRLLHKDGDHKRVDLPDECDAALADGWSLLPPEAESKTDTQ